MKTLLDMVKPTLRNSSHFCVGTPDDGELRIVGDIHPTAQEVHPAQPLQVPHRPPGQGPYISSSLSRA